MNFDSQDEIKPHISIKTFRAVDLLTPNLSEMPRNDSIFASVRKTNFLVHYEFIIEHK